MGRNVEGRKARWQKGRNARRRLSPPLRLAKFDCHRNAASRASVRKAVSRVAYPYGWPVRRQVAQAATCKATSTSQYKWLRTWLQRSLHDYLHRWHVEFGAVLNCVNRVDLEKKQRSSVWLLNKKRTLVFDKFSPSSQRCVVALQWAVQHLAQPFVANFVQAFAFMQCTHVVVYVFSLAQVFFDFRNGLSLCQGKGLFFLAC